MQSQTELNGSNVKRLVRKVLDHAIDGVPPLSGASALAKTYAVNRSYTSDDKRVDALIRWEASKNFTSGFLTGMGGLITLPVTVPASLGASWVIQARLCGAIAELYGHSLREDRVRTLVLLALVGDSAKEVLKDAGILFGKRLTLHVIEHLPAQALIELNKKVGFSLVAKAGEKGLVNLAKVVPVLGGVVSGSFDAGMCVGVGKAAKRIFRPGGEFVR
jgi:uncharacterized protein (DUF697 family)